MAGGVALTIFLMAVMFTGIVGIVLLGMSMEQ